MAVAYPRGQRGRQRDVSTDAGDKSATQPRWSPDGRWIAFLSAARQREGQGQSVPDSPRRWRGRSADERKVQHQHVQVGAGRQIGRVRHGRSQNRGRRESSKEKRDARVIDADEKLARLYIVPVEKDSDGKRPLKRLTEGSIHVTDLDWSPDSSTVVFSHQQTTKVFQQNDISTVAASGGDPRPLVATSANETSPVFSPDGKSIAYATSDDPPTWAFTAWARIIPEAGGSPGRSPRRSMSNRRFLAGRATGGP